MEDYPASAVPEIAGWSENYAFVCFDPLAGLGFMIHLGRWGEDPRTWRETLSIHLPGERLFVHKAFGRAGTGEIVSASMFRLEVIEPARRFRLRYDGPVRAYAQSELLEIGYGDGRVSRCEVDLMFEAAAPVWDMGAHAGGGASVGGSAHVEQVGLCHGIIRCGGAEYRVAQAYGNRDHSRGPRNVSQFSRHCWANGRREDGMAFNVYAVELQGGGPLAAKAAITAAGRLYDAEVTRIELIEGLHEAAKPYRISLLSELGKTEIELAHVNGTTPVSFTAPWDLHLGALKGQPSALLLEQSVIWRLDDAAAMGWSERGFLTQG
jgi:hypothetical protein